MAEGSASGLVGRARECDAIAAALEALPQRSGSIVVVEGEPGIGKSRLLAHLAASASASRPTGRQPHTVLGARASEFEADLPYALWIEALDHHLTDAGERRRSRLGLADPEALAALLSALGDQAPPETAAADRHRIHRALRDLLERLAASRPLVLAFDDVHWADPASLDAIAALVRRPPSAAVLVALAVRAGQLPGPLAVALAAAEREERVTALRLEPLSEAEALELVGGAAGAIYAQSGGNPFYLEQLARVPSTPGAGASRPGAAIPPAVAAAVAAELSALTPPARRLLDGAAVAGDPFEPALAGAVAELAEPEALQALDELLMNGLVRPGDAPRRFAFRHPIVRHAVYVATPGGWRLGAHARAAGALARRGAGPVLLAHHVEHAAQAGDEDAIGLLESAARQLESPAPATAARFYAAALGLLPGRPELGRRRIALQRALADARAAAGDPAAARDTLLDALETAPPGEHLALTVAVANQEWWLGGHEAARRRLQVALGELPAQPSPDRVRLRLALGLTALLGGDLAEAQGQAGDAAADAATLGDPVFQLAASALDTVARVSAAGGAAAREALDRSAASLERLSPAQLATRLPALWMLARARRGLGEFQSALDDLRRAEEVARRTGRERIVLTLVVESVPALIELGRPADAVAAAEEGLERAGLSGNPRMLVWARSALATARLAQGDVGAALDHAGEALRIDATADFHAMGQPGWCLGAALTAAGNADRAAATMLEAFDGPELAGVLPVDRSLAAADLIEAHLARDDLAAATDMLARAGSAAAAVGTAWAAAVAGNARAAVLLAAGQPAEAVSAAAAARQAASAAPLTAARSLLLEGRALAGAGQRRAAIETLVAAESELDALGARRRRDEAVRELRRLGHRVVRAAGGPADDPLTAREREVAELAADGRTNREIAEQLVLSDRTIEAHLRNVYAKLGVRSRVELTRELRAFGAG